MKVYIAGSITNNRNYVHQFADAENMLSKEGHTVLNPVKRTGFDYKEYIDMGLNELSKCDAICMLKGYEKSKGAMLELEYAKTVGLRIFFEIENERAEQ